MPTPRAVANLTTNAATVPGPPRTVCGTRCSCRNGPQLSQSLTSSWRWLIFPLLQCPDGSAAITPPPLLVTLTLSWRVFPAFFLTRSAGDEDTDSDDTDDGVADDDAAKPTPVSHPNASPSSPRLASRRALPSNGPTATSLLPSARLVLLLLLPPAYHVMGFGRTRKMERLAAQLPRVPSMRVCGQFHLLVATPNSGWVSVAGARTCAARKCVEPWQRRVAAWQSYGKICSRPCGWSRGGSR